MNAQMILQVVMAMIGALGFGLWFHMSGGRLLVITLGGAANWIFYLVGMAMYGDRVIAFFVAALATAVLAEILARLMKTPVITLLVPMLVPLIPGGDLYYTTLALVQGDMEAFAQYGGMFIREAGAISFGIILVACAVQMALRLWGLFREQKI
ncbi:threonine/serine exporter family protein [Agathobaculum sp. Marseille-P7918]|uniref:threonine/serine exporter family protein n=1 Tax=Agathobaculum sp. Marseille-P7918 TaxID=2479843 RepID=UPI0013DE235F|nr:threonine/serine exporter family protein [Agathobaculum sp. Marseille-P7918]